VKSSTTMVGAFYGGHFGEINSFGDPAFCAVGKRRGCHKPGSYAKFPAVHAKPAVFHGFFFIRKALHLPFCCRQDPVLIFWHKKLYLLLLIFILLGFNTHE
jgi:hypothetical protein